MPSQEGSEVYLWSPALSLQTGQTMYHCGSSPMSSVLTAVTGSSVQLECTCFSRPEPKYHWIHNDSLLSQLWWCACDPSTGVGRDRKVPGTLRPASPAHFESPRPVGRLILKTEMGWDTVEFWRQKQG